MITGIISGSYTLVQIPDGVSCYIPYVVLTILTLPAGIYLCFGPIKIPQYLLRFSKISKEEKAIKNIKKYIRLRKSRIAVFTILLVLMITTSMWMISMGNKHARAMATEHVRLLYLVKVMINVNTFALFTGLIIGMLIMEIAGVTKDKHMLTVNMWERIQELEDEVRELKGGTQEDNQNK
ncbi:MAG: hypothetical protein GY774_36480 [Planctomycetes bacterium]|nr:hypothetical protein [Planctomycetota bacterium]